MLSMPFALAPAGVLGSGSADARPQDCAAVRPSLRAPAAAVRGTGVPFAGMTRRRGPISAVLGFEAAPTATQQHDLISTNGTTPLGIHSPGRSTS